MVALVNVKTDYRARAPAKGRLRPPLFRQAKARRILPQSSIACSWPGTIWIAISS
jgi:hypothetical protein